jgi:hypothetical protein
VDTYETVSFVESVSRGAPSRGAPLPDTSTRCSRSLFGLSIAKGETSEFTLTFSPPPSLSKEAFEKQVGLADKELAKLKGPMES